MTRPDLAQQFVDSLPVIDRTIAALSARYAMTSAAAAEYSARVKRAIIADDYALLASSRGEFSFETYIATVAALIYRDHASAVSASRVNDALYGTFNDDAMRDAFEDASVVAPDVPSRATTARLEPKPPNSRRFVVGIVLAVIIGVAFLALRSSVEPYEPARFAADAAASPMMAQAPVWPPQALGSVTSPTGVAAQVGALLVDLEATSGSAATARTPAATLVRLLGNTPNGASAAQSLTALASGSSSVPSPSARRSAGKRALSAVDPGFASAGAYLEASRLAAASNALAFFDKHPPSALDQLRASTSNAEIRTAIDQFEIEARHTNRSALALASTAEAALRLITK